MAFVIGSAEPVPYHPGPKQLGIGAAYDAVDITRPPDHLSPACGPQCGIVDGKAAHCPCGVLCHVPPPVRNVDWFDDAGNRYRTLAVYDGDGQLVAGGTLLAGPDAP